MLKIIFKQLIKKPQTLQIYKHQRKKFFFFYFSYFYIKIKLRNKIVNIPKNLLKMLKNKQKTVIKH